MLALPRGRLGCRFGRIVIQLGPLELATLERGPEPVDRGLGAPTDGCDLAEVEHLAQDERAVFLRAAEQVGELVLREQDRSLEALVGQTS